MLRKRGSAHTNICTTSILCIYLWERCKLADCKHRACRKLRRRVVAQQHRAATGHANRGSKRSAAAEVDSTESHHQTHLKHSAQFVMNSVHWTPGSLQCPQPSGPTHAHAHRKHSVEPNHVDPSQTAASRNCVLQSSGTY